MSTSRHWTSQEDNLLRKYYPTTSWENLLTLIPDRPKRGIRVRASRIGIQKNKECLEFGMPFDGSIIGHLTETEKGYLAGILDGEGCIRLSRHKGEKGGYVYHIQVVITNTSRALIEWLNKKLPGISYQRQELPSAGRRNKTCFSWILAGNRRAIVFLKEITPYLVIKKKQAELLSTGYVHLSDEQRDCVYQKMGQLKKEA